MITSKRTGSVLFIAFTMNDLNRLNTDRFLPEVLANMKEPTTVVVLDMKPIKFIDSKGMSGLLEIQMTAEKMQAQVCLAGLDNKTTQVFRSLGIEEHFSYCHSIKAAYETYEP